MLLDMRTVMAESPAWQHFTNCPGQRLRAEPASHGPDLELRWEQFWEQFCLAAPGKHQVEGRYITTFSFSLEQYEAKSLEMISAYWSSTLLMVCSQVRAATRTQGHSKTEREDLESHSSETTECLSKLRGS